MAIMNSKLGRMWKSCVVYLCFYLFQVQVLHGYASTSGKYVGRGHARRAHGSSCAHQAPLLLQRQGMNRYSNMRLYYIKYDDEEEGSGGKLGKEDEDMDVVEQKATAIVKALGKNPVARIVTNSYSFFWNFPKKNMPFDTPWVFLRNSSAEFISWYQFPHNLPPYRYVGEEMGFRSDMFAYGLPGNTLPLGNWDPFGFQCVDKKMLLKYRESELKHGRLAMLACVGFVIQEISHPMHKDIGGMAITHMAQLQHLSDRSSIFKNIPSLESVVRVVCDALNFEVVSMSGKVENSVNDTYPFASLDYIFVICFLALFELVALSRN